VPPAVLARAFEMNEGGIARIEAEGFTGLVRVDAITPADLQAPEAVLLRAAFAAQAGQEMAQDAFALFARAVEQGAEIRLDEGAIAAVHAQVQ
jgi:peptidyl-prolyl cis-trans isomerase D